MAEGAHRVLQRFAAATGRGPLRCPITGCDGIPDHGQRLVRQGILAATIVRGLTSVVALEALVAYFQRGVMPEPHLDLPVESMPPIAALAARN
jgi:hypothetical protein